MGKEKRPIPVSNQKIKDWNKFLVDFNAAAERELPRKADGTPNWELLDKNEAFGDYKGGQDFYKKKFAEYVANNNVTGPDRLTEADFPVIQQLYADTYAAAKADQDYFNTYTKPRLEREGVDLNTFDPTTTVTGKSNPTGWIGTVSRHFTFDQDDKTGKGGTNPATQQHLETFFPASFSQGESFYKKNPTGPGVRYYDKGGKLMCYNEGGRMEMDVEVEEGGELEEISEDNVVVNSDESTKDSVTLTTGDKVGDKEVINTETKVVFGNLNDPATGNLFKDDALKRAKEMGQLEGHPMPWAKRRLDVLKRQEAEAYDRQQKLNGDNGGTNHDEGGDMNKVDVGPPVKKKLFYVPEDETMYQVSEDKIPKYADKLKNATEYTDVMPEGYTSDKVYLEKNGVLKEFTRENAEIILKQPEAAGSRQVYPVSTGQKKNQDVQSRFNDIESKLTEHSGLKSSTEISKENITAYKDKIEKQKSEDFPYPYNNIISQGANKSDKSPNTYLQNIYPTDSDYWLGAAKEMRSEDNKSLGNEVIDEMFLEEDRLREEYGFKELFSKGKDGLINQYNVDITATPQFKQYIDQKLSGGKIKTKDGKIFDLDKLPDDQKEEIRYFISGFYQQRKDIDEAIKQAELLRNGSEDPVIQKEYVEPRRQLIIEKTGIDPTTLKSSEEWSHIFKQIGEGSQKFVKEFQVMSSNIPIKVQQDLKPIKDEWQLKENELMEQGVKSLQELKMGLEHLVGAGELDYETAKGKYDAAFNKVEAEKTLLFNDYNQRYNRMSQQKITAGNEALRLSFEAKIVDLIEKSSGFKDLEGKDLSKLVVENATNYYKLIEGNLTEIQSDRANKTGELAAEIWGSKDDWEKWVDHSNKFVMGMFQGLGGGMQYLGGYEGGNILTDLSDQYNAENPTPSNLEYFDLSNPSSYLSKEAWINTGPYLMGSTLLFTLPGMAAGRGTAGAIAGSGIEMSELAATTIGSTPMRFLESFINSGQYFNEKIQGGMSIDEASEKTSGVFANNMMLTFMDGGQTTMAFTKAGKSSIWRNILSKSGKVLVGTGSEGIDESLSSYFAAVADNPYITYFKYLQAPAGMQAFSAGATGGIFFAAPDLITESSGKENQHRLGLLLDMMGDPSEIETRYLQLVSTGDMLKTRGTMTMDEYKTFQTALEFVKEKNSAIPVDLPADTRKAVLYKLADIQDATNVMSSSVDPTIQKTYEAKIKELEKEVKDLVVGSSPTYFINNSLFSEQEFKQIISDDRVLKGLVDTKTSLRINNDEKLQTELDERIEKIKTLPEVVEEAVAEEGVITSDPTVDPIVENQEVTEEVISETPENTEVFNEDLTVDPVVEEIADATPEIVEEKVADIKIDLANPETYTAQPIELEEATSTLGKEPLLTYDENKSPVEITTPEQLAEAKEIFVAKPIDEGFDIKAIEEKIVSRETIQEPAKVSVSHTEKAKIIADKIRSLKSKPLKIKTIDESGNEIESEVVTNDFWNTLVEVAAQAVETSGKIADGVKAALIHTRKQDWYKALTEEQQVDIDRQIKEQLEVETEEEIAEETGKKERGLSKTARKVDAAEKKEVKSLLDKDPQFYRQVSNDESIKKAQDFIDEHGIEQSTDLALDKNVSVQDGLMANTLGLVLMDFYGQQAAKLEGAEKTKALNKVVQLSEAVGERMTLSGQQGQVMAVWTKMTPEAALLSVSKAIKRYNESPQGEKRRKKFKKAVQGYKTEQEKVAKDVVNSEKVKKIKTEKVLTETEKKITEQKKREHAAIDKAADALITRLLGNDQNLYSTLIPIPPGVIKGFIKTFASALKAGSDLKAAIKKAIAYLKVQMGDVDIDYEKWEKLLEDSYPGMMKDVKTELEKTKGDKWLEKYYEEKNKEQKPKQKRSAPEITTIEQAIKQALREKNLRIDAIITSHLTERALTKQELIDKLVKDSGISESSAKELATAIEEEFNRLTKGGAKKLIEKYFGNLEKKGKETEEQKVEKRDQNSVINKINQTLNLNGLVSEDLLTKYFGERFGVKSLTPQATANILKYSEAVQKTEGKFKERATQQLVQEISKMYGPSAMDIYWALWYPSMLSGLSTSTINVTNNAANVISKYFENPLNPSLWLKSIKDAIKNKDPKVFLYGNPLTETLMKPVYFFKGIGQSSRYTYNEMVDIMQKGMLDDKFADRQFTGGNKVEMSVLEDKRIQNIPILKYLEFYKYVGRFLQSQDAFFFRNNEESEFISSVYRQFTEKGLTGKELYQAVYDEVVGGADKAESTLRMEKEAETYESITGNKLSKAQKTLRLIEILREGRNKEAQEEAKESAETMVYRGDYRGGIGTIAYMLSTVTQSKNPVGSGVRLFVPFTKIVSNVFNYMIDYTPVYGMLRANGLGITGLSERLRGPLKFMHKEIKSSQMGDVGSKAYYDQMGRAWIGLTSFTTLAAIIASQLDKDDDEEDKIFIVGNHAGLNYEQSRNMEITDPKGTIRIGKNGTPIPYRTIPALDVPLTILGNWMDLHRWKEGKGANEKVGLAILSSKNTFLEKSFVKGINDLVTTVFDKKDNLQKTLGDLAKQGLGYATKPLPQNSTLVTQIDDIFSKYEYKPEEIEDILKYSAYNGWNLDKPKLDVFGHPIKTYPGEQILPIQHWFTLQDEDPVWKKLADEGLTKKISKFGDLHLYDDEGNALPTTDDQQYIYKAYAGREWYKLLNEYLNDEYLMSEKLSEHDFKGVDPDNIDKKAKEKIIELAKAEAAKIAYYRIAQEYGQKYNLKDLDWIKFVPEVTLDEIEE